MSKLDIYQSETQVAERERDVVQAEYQYCVLLDGLRRLIGADLRPQLREAELVLDDDASVLPDKAAVLPFEEAPQQALKARPEAEAASGAIHLDELNAKAGRDALQPRLDLSLRVDRRGRITTRWVQEWWLDRRKLLRRRDSAQRCNRCGSLPVRLMGSV